MPTVKQCNELVDFYDEIYIEHYNKAPRINRYSARWGFDSVLLSMDKETAKELLKYYLRTESPNLHSIEWFFYHYTELQESREKAAVDDEARRELREESRIRAMEWRNKLDKS